MGILYYCSGLAYKRGTHPCAIGPPSPLVVRCAFTVCITCVVLTRLYCLCLCDKIEVTSKVENRHHTSEPGICEALRLLATDAINAMCGQADACRAQQSVAESSSHFLHVRVLVARSR